MFRTGVKSAHWSKERESETQKERSFGGGLWSEVAWVPALALDTWKLWLIGLL